MGAEICGHPMSLANALRPAPDHVRRQPPDPEAPPRDHEEHPLTVCVRDEGRRLRAVRLVGQFIDFDTGEASKASMHILFVLKHPDPNVDVVYVSTPHPFHAPGAKLALHAGKHVLLEKPFTVNAAEARGVIALAAAFVVDAIAQLVASRQYEPGEVSDDDLNQILEIARWSGSSRNTQPWRFVVVRDKDTLKQLSDLRPNITWVADGALVVAGHVARGAGVAGAGPARCCEGPGVRGPARRAPCPGPG